MDIEIVTKILNYLNTYWDTYIAMQIVRHIIIEIHRVE